ncbi:hypothetical protein H8356DRAFT_1325302 [Neocallimastix lanati (nom. inval.)]|nr:hypothetical protein H8356DRAFT_1325302 [Neocallimastix sp. JGI-2020a]
MRRQYLSPVRAPLLLLVAAHNTSLRVCLELNFLYIPTYISINHQRQNGNHSLPLRVVVSGLGEQAVNGMSWITLGDLNSGHYSNLCCLNRLDLCSLSYILDNKKEILKYESLHNHLEKEFDFDEIPDESKYYKTVRNENSMIFKNPNLIIFQSPFQAKLFMKFNEDIFAEEQLLIRNKKKNSEKYSNDTIITPKSFSLGFPKKAYQMQKKKYFPIKIRCETKESLSYIMITKERKTDEINILIEKYETMKSKLIDNGRSRK